MFSDPRKQANVKSVFLDSMVEYTVGVVAVDKQLSVYVVYIATVLLSVLTNHSQRENGRWAAI